MRRLAIGQARLEPLALSASGHERMISRWTAASGEVVASGKWRENSGQWGSLVSLVLAIKPNLSQSDRIQIIAADLTDAYGRPIDGNDDGVPGGCDRCPPRPEPSVERGT